MIEVQELTKRYGATTAVDAISFHVPRGEIVGFLGPNGAGKSTTLRMITGYLSPTSGRVRVAGIDVHDKPREARRLIGYMPEGVPMYRDMRVVEYLRFRAELKELGRREVKAAVDRALGQADVTDAADKVIGRLSKGYRQRVGLADALLTDPPLLILDEPSSGLDPNQNRHVRELLRSFEGTKTVFLSTHILPQVENVCSRIIIIRKGQLMAQGKASELRQSPTGTRLITLGGPASAEAYEKAVSGLEGVRNVELLGDQAGGNAVRLTAVPGDEVLEAIFQAVVAQGLSLHRLVPESASLESVFADLTTTDPAGEPEDEADEGSDQADASEGGCLVKSMWAIAKRDVRSFFVSPLAWVVLTIWMLVCGGQFYIMCGWFAQNPSSGGSDNPVAFFYGGTVLFFLALLVFVPILTMRLLAEERQSGIDEAMLTTPVTPLAMVMGKYLAAMTFWTAMWVPTLMYVWICKNFGYADWGATGAIFVGVFGIGLHYMAIGLLSSAIASTQLVAAVIAFFILSTFFVLGIASSVLPDWAEVLNYISVMEHMRAYSRGIIDSRYLAFDVLTAVLALFLSVRVVDARRYQ